ncbi:MAG: VWA domain-containing protein [Acidobacteriota bacterium]|nr:VWA domain-containing protein [Acidobacteriota bacterium]
MMGKRTITGLLVLLAAAGLIGWAEDDVPAEKERVGGLAFVDEVEVTVVNIEVFVRDKDGVPVTDLGIDDFEVFQDGEQRKLTNFMLVDKTVRETILDSRSTALAKEPTEAGTPLPSQPEIRPVHIVVYIDNENLLPFDRNRVLSHVRDFLADTVGPGVEAMIVSNQGSPKVIQAFSSDPQELGAALRELRRGTGGRTSLQSQHAALRRDLVRLANEGLDRDGNSQKAILALEDLISYADQVQAELVRDITAVRMLGAGLTGLPGRKCLVYVSSGLPMVVGKDLFYQFTNYFQGRSMLSLSARYNQRAEYSDLAAAANSQGMVFYTIDARGSAPASGISAESGVSGDPSADAIYQMNLEQPLLFLAEKTGGLATVGTNNFEAGLDRVREDILTYYSLGYPITSAGGDRVHRIEVKLPGHSNFDVRHRRTFVEKSMESEVQDRVMTALLFDVDENPMGVEATVGEPSAAQEGRFLLPLRVSFPTESVALLPEGDTLKGEVVLFVSLRDSAGKQADLQSRVQPISIPSAEYARMAKLPLSIDLQLLVVSGRYRISVGLFDRLTRQSSYQTLATSIPEN